MTQASAAVKAALEIEVEVMKARLDRSAAEAQRLRVETDELREETLRLEVRGRP